jgi:hypothetical protein
MPSSSGRRRERVVLAAFASAWLVTIGGGMGVLYAHQARAGAAASAPATWPADGAIARDPARHTLVMLAHPRCPCTRASIDELAIVMDRLQGRLSARVLFVKPAGAGSEWESGLLASAARIPGVSVIVDEGGRHAERLGARTSGQVLLYGPGGELEFAGGITPGRAHVGDNVGRQRIISLVTRAATARRSSSVYGCPLFEEQRRE